mgnify:CR=1 FL=1
MAEKQTLLAGRDNKTKQPALLATRCNIMKIMKGKEEITGKPWKSHSINNSNYECNNLEIALSPKTTLFDVKISKARQTALHYTTLHYTTLHYTTSKPRIT